MNSRPSFLLKLNIILGNLFEHYDTALFTLLSPFFAPLFFPHEDPVTALIMTYWIIPLGMLARPFGSLVFGYIGDQYGRKEALVLSLLGMALFTVIMGLLPCYYRIGFFAPLLFSGIRILQNFFGAGESMGGGIFLLEHTHESQKDLMSGFFNSSTVGGILLASVGVSILYFFDNVEKYWRLLYFFGGITALCVVFLRIKTPFRSLFINVSSESSIRSALRTCWIQRQALLAIAVTSGFSYASYSLSLILMNGFAPLVSNVTQAQMLHLNTFLLVIDFFLLPLFGILAQKYSRRKMMIFAGLATTLTGLPLFGMLDGASLPMVIAIRSLFVIIGVWFCAPFHAWMQTLVPVSQRYTVISFGYAIGSQLIGAPTAAISLWLFQKTNWIPSVGAYWMLLGLLASYSVAKQAVLEDDFRACSVS